MQMKMAVFVALLLAAAAAGQKPEGGTNRLLSALPADLRLQEKTPQGYRFTCDYFHVTPTGDLIRKQRVAAHYTRALPGGRVRWTEVTVAGARGFDDPFPPGEKQSYMEGFAYLHSEREKMLQPEFFKGFPADPTAMLARNLVWDTHMMERFGQDYLGQLKPNEAYRPHAKAEDVPLAGGGTFRNRQVELVWLGQSRMNGKNCALIQYRAFLNPLDLRTGGFAAKGKSSYWGEIWVSLEDKQIERGTLYEDVLLQLAGQPAPQQVNVFRQGALEKVPPP